MAQYDLNSEQHIERLEGFLLRLKDVLKNTLTFVKNGEKDNINPHILIGEVVLVLEDAVSRIDTLKQG